MPLAARLQFDNVSRSYPNDTLRAMAHRLQFPLVDGISLSILLVFAEPVAAIIS